MTDPIPWSLKSRQSRRRGPELVTAPAFVSFRWFCCAGAVASRFLPSPPSPPAFRHRPHSSPCPFLPLSPFPARTPAPAPFLPIFARSSSAPQSLRSSCLPLTPRTKCVITKALSSDHVLSFRTLTHFVRRWARDRVRDRARNTLRGSVKPICPR